jgi:hypothetical protein
VVRDLRHVTVDVRGVDSLQRLADAPVERGCLAVAKTMEQSASDQVVPEREGLLGWLDEPARDRLVEALERRRVHHAFDHLTLERVPDDRRGEQHVAGPVREAAQPRPHHVARALGHTLDTSGKIEILLGDVAEDLLDEERIAGGLVPERTQHHRRWPAAVSLGDELGELGLGETPQLGAHDEMVPVQVVVDSKQGMVARDLRAPVGAEEQKRLLAVRSHQVAEHPERRGVHGVEIVDDEHERSGPAEDGQQRVDRREQERAVRVGIAGRRRRDPRRQVGEHESEMPGVAADLGEHALHRVFAQSWSKGVYERSVREAHAVVTATCEYDAALARDLGPELRQQARFPDPGLAGEQHRAAASCPDPVPGAAKPLPGGLSPHHGRTPQLSQPTRQPALTGARRR